MQPPTEPTPAAARQTPRGNQGELYRRHHRDLQRAVARAVNAPRELIEDACQNAWAILLRAQPARTSIFGWLYVVATREAFRLCERERRHDHLEAMFPAGTWDTVIADASSVDDVLEAREALEILASLPDRQRADLTLLVAGFNYNEIAELTGGRTYTTSTSISRRRVHASGSRASAELLAPKAGTRRVGGQLRPDRLFKSEMTVRAPRLDGRPK